MREREEMPDEAEDRNTAFTTTRESGKLCCIFLHYSYTCSAVGNDTAYFTDSVIRSSAPPTGNTEKNKVLNGKLAGESFQH